MQGPHLNSAEVPDPALCIPGAGARCLPRLSPTETPAPGPLGRNEESLS